MIRRFNVDQVRLRIPRCGATVEDVARQLERQLGDRRLAQKAARAIEYALARQGQDPRRGALP